MILENAHGLIIYLYLSRTNSCKSPLGLKCGQYASPPAIQPSLIADGGGKDQNLDNFVIT
jgi:hypothetical protein